MPRVLMIHVDHAALETFGSALRRAGFDVALASSGEEGLKIVLEWCGHERADVPLVIVDDLVTGSSGVDHKREAADCASPQVNHAMRLIEERFRHADLNLRSVARDVGFTGEHLCRALKRHTGCTFMTLLRHTRVRAACQLLEDTTLSMKQIAHRVGCRSASRFDRDFKRVRGVPPSEYRLAMLRRSR